MCPANKKSASGSALRASVGSGEWIGAARLSGLALRASVGSEKSTSRSPLPTSYFPLTALPSLLLAIIFFYTPTSFAEHADRDKPIHLEADQVRIDDAQQISTFIGNVKLSQGTLLIRGDKIVVTQDKDGFKHGTAYGNTA
ncbi:MAG: LptA/OstA family protein, partial [Gallionella sp.]|nr:LptA/OstA family protein [Gallionella sp.]